MSVTDISLRPKSILTIMMRVLIIFVLFVSIMPINKPDVNAQEPDKPQIVYLPLEFKNSTVSCPEGPDQWLCLLNYYRITAGLIQIIRNDTYSYGLSLHTNYLLLNPTSNLHIEDPNLPGYTNEGAYAGVNSNMARLPGKGLTVEDSINLWLEAIDREEILIRE